MRILVIEDEPRMLQLLRQGLHEHGCAVMTAIDGETGLEIASECEFDVIVLDIGLPKCDGYEVLRTLQNRNSAARVLMLTARDAEDEIIRGLDLGADDYMTKPFSFLELTARLQALARVQREVEGNRLAAGNVVIDLGRHSVQRENRNLDLTRSEFLLLLALMREAGRCVSRQRLSESIWGEGAEVSPGALDVLVNALRSKLDSPFRQKLIRTVRGSGYLLDSASTTITHQWETAGR